MNATATSSLVALNRLSIRYFEDWSVGTRPSIVGPDDGKRIFQISLLVNLRDELKRDLIREYEVRWVDGETDGKVLNRLVLLRRGVVSCGGDREYAGSRT